MTQLIGAAPTLFSNAVMRILVTSRLSRVSLDLVTVTSGCDEARLRVVACCLRQKLRDTYALESSQRALENHTQ